ncbi:MAG: hypothetical protein ACE14P_04650 [Methanotrichaceae archaeon]
MKWMIFFSLVLCFSGWQAFAADQGTSGELSSIEQPTSGPTWEQGPVEGAAIVAVRTGSAAGAGHVGVAFYNPFTGKWIAGAVEGYNSAGYIKAGDKNGGWYREFDTKEEVISEFFSDTSPDANTDYPGHAAYDKIKIIPVEESRPGLASKEFDGIEDSGYLLTQNDCLGLTNDVLKAYGVPAQDLPSGVSPLESSQSDTTILDIEKTTLPNVYYNDLMGDKITEVSKESWDDSQKNSNQLVDVLGIGTLQWQKTKPIVTSQSNTQKISTATESSESTSQSLMQNVPGTAQCTEPSTGSDSPSTGTFDAYSEGKKIVKEFFASGEAEDALQEGLQSGTEGSGQSTGETSSEESNLAGINFTSIKLNSISVATDGSGGVNFDLILKAEKAEGAKPGINIQNATRIGAAAFMTGLAVNDNKFWVNLNPWEVDRIIDEELGQSEVGRIMLEADLQMKKDFGNYGNPCANETGKVLWGLLDKKREDLVQRCMNKFPGEIKETSNIIFKPVQRHWIVPDKACAYSNESLIYIINASLTINSEPVTDHSSFQVNNQDINTLSRDCVEELNRSAKEYAEYYKNLEERMIQPYIVADINADEKYEDLREVYAALALAQWYKSKTTPHTDIFRDGLDSSSVSIFKSQTPWHPKDIWDQYVYSFKNGEYKCWENTTTKTAKGTRTKFSLHSAGGVEFGDIRDHFVKIEVMSLEVQNQAKKAITDGFIDNRDEVLFGYRLHVDQKKDDQITNISSGPSIKSQNLNQSIEDPLKGNSSIDETRLNNKKAQNQSRETPSAAKVGGNIRHVTCPDGWTGPDENGECWQMQITG